MRLPSLLLIAAFAGLTGCGRTAPPAPVGPVATASIQDIMKSVVAPAANAIWKPPAAISDPASSKAPPAEVAADWLVLRHSAVALVEAPNLLIMEGRRAAAPGAKLQDEGAEGILPNAQIQQRLETERAEFRQYARRLQTASLETLAAIDRKDADALLDAGGKVDEACEACHQHFWYPSAKPSK